MTSDEAEQVSTLFGDVLNDLPYYNAQAKQSELAKYTAAHLRELLACDQESVLLAKIGGRLAAFCFTRLDEGLVWMSWIGVHPNYRRTGLASVLLEALDARARRLNAIKIWCDSRADNEPSKRALALNGYEQICTISNHWHGQDYILWQKFVG